MKEAAMRRGGMILRRCDAIGAILGEEECASRRVCQ